MMHILMVIAIAMSWSVHTDSKKEGRCANCEVIVSKFMLGLKDTKNKNFGGGDTDWEEKSLKSYSISETRLIEIIESISKDITMPVATMLEENEENLEKWFFNEMKVKDSDVDVKLALRSYLCVETVKACCPKGKFGKRCRECPVSPENPCNNNGNCSGEGTRRGNGICICKPGYIGEMCNLCDKSYFATTPKDAEVINCKACDVSCEEGCTKSGPKGCIKCAQGWKMDKEKCIDKNECKDSLLPCKDDEYCTNSVGSFKCQACDVSCSGCTDTGNDNCIMCADGYFDHEDKCQACHSSCSTTCTDFTPLTCEDCKNGFEMKEGVGCIDINECDKNPCEMNEYCVNIDGDYLCKFCNESCKSCHNEGASNCLKCNTGYQMENNTCKDIDECEEMKKLEDFILCDEKKETCANHPGGFTCKCNAGYLRDVSGICVDEAIVKEKEEILQKKLDAKRKKMQEEYYEKQSQPSEEVEESVEDEDAMPTPPSPDQDGSQPDFDSSVKNEL